MTQLLAAARQGAATRLLPLRPVLIGELHRRCHGDAHWGGVNGHGSAGMRCQDTLVTLFRNSETWRDGTIRVDGILPLRIAGAIFLDTRHTEVPPDAGCSSQLSQETVVQL